jgi:hypothetical protein
MTKYKRQSVKTPEVSREKGKIPAGKETDAGDPETCRCKEVAKKTPREMLSLMISDMAFWKKGKGHK